MPPRTGDWRRQTPNGAIRVTAASRVLCSPCFCFSPFESFLFSTPTYHQAHGFRSRGEEGIPRSPLDYWVATARSTVGLCLESRFKSLFCKSPFPAPRDSISSGSKPDLRAQSLKQCHQARPQVPLARQQGDRLRTGPVLSSQQGSAKPGPLLCACLRLHALSVRV